MDTTEGVCLIIVNPIRPSLAPRPTAKTAVLQGDSRLGNQLLQQCQLYGLPQVAVGLCRQMGVHHWQNGRTAAALTWFIRGTWLLLMLMISLNSPQLLLLLLL